MPETGLSPFQISGWLVALLIVLALAILAMTVIWVVRAHRRKVSAGREDLVGKTAEVRVALNPKGAVFVDGEWWTGISESGRVEPGEEVRITRVDGLKLYVTRKE